MVFETACHSDLALCGVSDAKVEPLDPPAGGKLGERVFVAGYEEVSCGG